MTPAEIRAIRVALGLSADRFARLLGIAGGRSVRRWEAGDAPVPGTVSVLATALRDNAAVRAHFGLTATISGEKARPRR